MKISREITGLTDGQIHNLLALGGWEVAVFGDWQQYLYRRNEKGALVRELHRYPAYRYAMYFAPLLEIHRVLEQSAHIVCKPLSHIPSSVLRRAFYCMHKAGVV